MKNITVLKSSEVTIPRYIIKKCLKLLLHCINQRMSEFEFVVLINTQKGFMKATEYMENTEVIAFGIRRK